MAHGGCLETFAVGDGDKAAAVGGQELSRGLEERVSAVTSLLVGCVLVLAT